MTHSLRFGRAEIRPAERQLLLDGQPVAMGARAFDVLNLLIRHRERVVGKSEVLEAVWPGLVVEENNLQVQVSTLRKILGAGAISTIPGQGYRFTASVENDSSAPPPAVGAQTELEAPAPSERNAAPNAPPQLAGSKAGSSTQRYRALLAVVGTLVVILGISLWISLRERPVGPAATVTRIVAPPAHSVGVLPFVNMSGDPKEDYFSDGLSEELLNSLSTIPDLHVAARTSSFTFKGKDARVADIGHQLNVGTLLEGSVRKDGQHVRVTVHLVDVATGFDLWSQAYDRDLTNILVLQIEIATAVTNALQATLLPDAATAVETGGTKNPQAFEAYLRAETLKGRVDKEALLARIAAYDEAIRLDPDFAKAYVGKALALGLFGGNVAAAPDVQDYYSQARAAAEKALVLAPDLGRAHSALGQILLFGFFDFSHSLIENERALALSPGDTFVLQSSVLPLSFAGRTESAVTNAQRAVDLDPVNALSYESFGLALYYARQYRRAIEAFDRALSVNPQLDGAFRGFAYRRLGELDAAIRSCSIPPINIPNHVCLAIAYRQSNRISEATVEVEKIKQSLGDAAAYQYAEIYTQWGDVSRALRWLESAYRLRDPGLVSLKESELLDPLRAEPRFKEIERLLELPN